MKVVDPRSLLRDAAVVLQGVKEEVVVVGAAALEVALAGAPAKVEPTRDVDLAVSATNAEKVIAHLEAAKLTRSDAPHENRSPGSAGI